MKVLQTGPWIKLFQMEDPVQSINKTQNNMVYLSQFPDIYIDLNLWLQPIIMCHLGRGMYWKVLLIIFKFIIEFHSFILTVLFLKTDYQNSTNDGTKHFYKFYLLMKIFSTNFTRIIFYDVHSFCVDENLILQRQRVRREQELFISGFFEHTNIILKCTIFGYNLKGTLVKAQVCQLQCVSRHPASCEFVLRLLVSPKAPMWPQDWAQISCRSETLSNGFNNEAGGWSAKGKK